MAIIDTLLGKFRGNRPQQNDTLNTYLQALPDYDYAKPLLNEYTPEQLQMGVRNNLNFGVPEIADWQQQYNQGAGRNNPLVTPDNPEQFKQDLKSGNTAQFSLGANSSPSIWNRIGNKIGNSINDFTSGYKENVSTPFAVENLERGNKSFATRAGELGGSLRRMFDNPLSRGLITAGLVGATGGSGADALAYGLQSGVTRQGLATQDKVYRKQLQDMGVDTSNITGDITENMFKNIAATLYKNRKLDQDTYNRERTALQQMLNTGNLSPQEYLMQVDDLNKEYARSLARTMDINNVGVSNQTRNANVNEIYGPLRAQGMALSNQFEAATLDDRINQEKNKAMGNIQLRKQAQSTISTNNQAINSLENLKKQIEQNPNATGYIIGSLAKGGDLKRNIANKVSGSQGNINVRSGIANIRSSIIKDRSGTAQTAAEMQNLAPYLPDVTDDSETAIRKINTMIQQIKGINSSVMENAQVNGIYLPQSDVQGQSANINQNAGNKEVRTLPSGATVTITRN